MIHSQSFNRFQHPALVEDLPGEQQPPPRPERAGPLRRFWNAWLWLTGPRPERFASGITGQEGLRRSRLVSALLLLVTISMAMVIPSAIAIPGFWQVILLLGGLALLAALLNRIGQVSLGGLTVILLTDLSIIQTILMRPYGLTNSTLSDLYLLVISILIAGMILPNLLIPITGGIQIAISLAIFYILPHDTLLTQEIRKVDGNQDYTAILGPILLLICSTGIVWLYAWSVERAIWRADRAEELAAARAHIDEQARQIAAQKQRLEEGIQTIQEVQARVANGEYSARVSLQGNELLPLGVSFNIMAERLSRVERIEQEYQRLENALQLLLDACDMLARGTTPISLRATGTPVDRVFPFLTRLQQLSTQLAQGSTLAEDLRSVLERQIEHLSLAETRLIGSLSLANDLAIQTVQTLTQPAGERTSGPLDAQSKSEASNAVTQISSLLDKQITLLEQVKQYDERARDLGTRCMQGARILSQRLKESR
jgi:hypothetical protein